MGTSGGWLVGGFLSVMACGVAGAALAEPLAATISTISCPADGGLRLEGARPAFQRDGAVVRRAGQTHHFPQANLTLGLTTAADGSHRIEGRSGNMAFRKSIRAGGQSLLELETPGDVVSVEFSEALVTATRNGVSRSVARGSASDEDQATVWRLLAGSPSISLLRRAAAAIQQAEDDSPAAAAVIMSDAVVGMLTGDVGAPGRAARHLARHSLGGMRRVASVDCYSVWQTRVVAAWSRLTSCLNDFSYNYLSMGCGFEWTLAVESYWWQFISCSSFPF